MEWGGIGHRWAKRTTGTCGVRATLSFRKLIFMFIYNNSLLVVVPTGCANLSDLGTEIYIVFLHCASEFRLYPCSYFCSVTLTIHLGTLSFKWSTEPHLLRLLVSQIQVLILSIPSQLCNYSDAFCLVVKF